VVVGAFGPRLRDDVARRTKIILLRTDEPGFPAPGPMALWFRLPQPRPLRVAFLQIQPRFLSRLRRCSVYLLIKKYISKLLAVKPSVERNPPTTTESIAARQGLKSSQSGRGAALATPAPGPQRPSLLKRSGPPLRREPTAQGELAAAAVAVLKGRRESILLSSTRLSTKAPIEQSGPAPGAHNGRIGYCAFQATTESRPPRERILHRSTLKLLLRRVDVGATLPHCSTLPGP
jgi:hypothetical protein